VQIEKHSGQINGAKISAVIDVGSNSAILLIASINADSSVSIICDQCIITKLGDGLSRTGMISNEAADRTISTLSSFLSTCAKNGVTDISAMGTFALRKASNAKQFINRVKTELGLTIDVIGNNKEARLTYEASAHDFGKEIMVMDIGGGSTEIVFGPPPLKVKSLPLGCLSMTEQYIRSIPVDSEDEKSLRDAIASMMHKSINPDEIRFNKIVATGGSATTLMAMNFSLKDYDSKYIHGQNLNRHTLEKLISDIRDKKLNELKKMSGLSPQRAEVIFAGAIIFDEIMKFMEIDEAIISDRGIRWALIYEILDVT